MEIFAQVFASDGIPKFDKLLENLTDDEVDILGEYLQKKTYRSDDIICNQKTPRNSLFIILEGTVNLYTANSTSPAKKSHVAKLEKGDIFCEIGFFSQETGCISAESSGDSRLFKLTSENFRKLLSVYPAVGSKICHALCMILAARLTSTCKELNRMQLAGEI